MARRAARVDANHKSIADFFKAHGCEVESLARLGNGVPDLLVGAGVYGRVALVEVKGAHGTLTEDQAGFVKRFPCWIVRNETDARKVIRWLRNGR